MIKDLIQRYVKKINGYESIRNDGSTTDAPDSGGVEPVRPWERSEYNLPDFDKVYEDLKDKVTSNMSDDDILDLMSENLDISMIKDALLMNYIDSVEWTEPFEMSDLDANDILDMFMVRLFGHCTTRHNRDMCKYPGNGDAPDMSIYPNGLMCINRVEVTHRNAQYAFSFHEVSRAVNDLFLKLEKSSMNKKNSEFLNDVKIQLKSNK